MLLPTCSIKLEIESSIIDVQIGRIHYSLSEP